MPWEPVRSAPLPAPVTSAARRCAARFAERTASLRDFAPLVRLYLQADLDTDATALLARRLRELGPTRVRERKAVMDSVFAIYLEAQPSRLDAAEALLRQWPTTERIPRLKEYVLLALASYRAGDTSRARRMTAPM